MAVPAAFVNRYIERFDASFFDFNNMCCNVVISYLARMKLNSFDIQVAIAFAFELIEMDQPFPSQGVVHQLFNSFLAIESYSVIGKNICECIQANISSDEQLLNSAAERLLLLWQQKYARCHVNMSILHNKINAYRRPESQASIVSASIDVKRFILLSIELLV